MASSFKVSTHSYTTPLLRLLHLSPPKPPSFSSFYTFCRLGFSSILIHHPSSSRPRFLSGSSLTFMEVVKEAARQGSATHKSMALRVDQLSYSYFQLVLSAWKISNLLRNRDFKNTQEVNKKEITSPLGGAGHLEGARIGIVAKPSAEFVAGLLGTWLSGGVAVPLALNYPEAELYHVMNDSDISVILGTEEHQELMESVSSKCESHFSLITPVPNASSNVSAGEIQMADFLEEIENPKIAGDDPALIVYTSGTTGKPKGVVHTHESIKAQVQILTEAWEYTSADQFLHCLPLHHVHGLFNALLAPLYAGSVVEFMPKFSVRGIWQRWRESYPKDGSKVDGAITVFTGVPTMYTRLLQGYEAMDPESKATSASAAQQLRLMMCGSSALPHPVMKQWESITGHRLLERYGMTEFVMALSNPLRGNRKGGTVGKPLPGVQVKILEEDESGSDTMGVGELCVRSPSLFKEYWKQPKVTKESFIDGGFFKTGDTVRMDEDGYYIILGRTSADIMKVGGYKLSALDIEAVLLEHPAVSECCVVRLIRTEKKSSNQLSAWKNFALGAKDRLAPYKIPTRLFLWESLPRNAMGKVNKKGAEENCCND
ncbi:hypothetical protein MRB53_012451 [Persea americana]|uniref:Uncharacterized protein n=1 Tax=Persea americana TaxID=3435 RepID=A0ACC2LXL9_PERAE|nr:hypothetical protein MRB53_012451 [Persea americana]